MPSLSPLTDLVAADPAVAGALAAVGHERRYDLVAPPGLRPFVTAAIAARAPVLAVVATGREADELTAGLRSLLGPGAVALFPSWETLPHERLSPRSDTVGRRMAVLHRLAHPEGRPLQVVVCPVRSVLQPMLRGLGDVEPVRLEVGGTADLDDVVTRLAELAYTRVDLVERRGEFAVRGGLLDVFPPTEEHPLRVELFGDDVEDIRLFSVADQRTIAPADSADSRRAAGGSVLAPPCRELLLTDDVQQRAKALLARHPELADILGRVADGIAVEGMEALAPVLAPDHPDGPLGLLLDELPAGTHVLVADPERVRTRAHELVRTGAEFLAASWSAAALGGESPVDLEPAAYRDLSVVLEKAAAQGLPWWTLAPFGEGDTIDAQPAPELRGDGDAITDLVDRLVHQRVRVVVTAAGHGSAGRIAEMLTAADIPAAYRESLDAEPAPGSVTALPAELAHGFTTPTLALLTESDLLGTKGIASGAKLPTRRRGVVDPLTLTTGDPVVHEVHGVGRYVELVQRTVAGATREYLVLEYAPPRKGFPGDRVFVPTDALDQLTRYVGGENPPIHRLGGAEWQKAKGRARKAVREIAGELIRLYAARQAAPGFAFGPDTPWQRELEDAFPYRETPDQAAAIDEVKADMALPVPMDRIVCGDVGFGKTEIAVRAAFKAVQDGKQVAILCPTTLLARQHYNTFSERYAQFPVKVAMSSRFSTEAEQKQVEAGLADGTVDVVIGTHRLLQKDIRFKDIGLLVVDEEQRFGVEHKEQIKAIRAAVDVLSMSATPIPRTLEMSLTGIREMSVIATPPEERQPVLTFVGAYDDKQVSAAIHRELLREGQVFYIHNRVESIDRAAARLRDLVPEARIAVAHGQMHEDLLEQVMLGFWEKDYDVLVCTTIVESGLDIPNANTLVVERADAFGLSQLHQLRGRVGRGRDRAYAYVLYPPDKPLTETAHDRLATIAQHADLGGGMAIALKDLEIRGAGNLLGGEQSGHIAGVGFDLYVRMVGEAVRDWQRGLDPDQIAEEEAREVKVELPVDAHLPHDYVDSERLRLEAYRRLAEAQDDAAVAAVRDELTDRYGTPPPPALNLLAVASFRVRARAEGLADVGLQGPKVRFSPWELKESQQLRLARLFPGSVVKAGAGQVLVPRPTDTGRLGGTPLRDQALLTWATAVIDAVAGSPAA